MERAQALAITLGFTLSSRPEVGRLLRTLVASVRDGRRRDGHRHRRWDGLDGERPQPAGTLVTVELDAERATAASGLFAGLPNVQVLHADASELLAHGPFDLLFVDSGWRWEGHRARLASRDDVDLLAPLLAAMRPGGLIVLDDLTPEAAWPPLARRSLTRPVQLWLHDPRLAAVELMVDPSAGPGAP